MKIYLAGKIAGDPYYKEKFDAYARGIEENGDVALNPATIPEGLPVKDCMRICFAMIDVADDVYFLPDWEESGGAQLEKAYCDYIGKPYSLPRKRKEKEK